MADAKSGAAAAPAAAANLSNLPAADARVRRQRLKKTPFGTDAADASPSAGTATVDSESLQAIIKRVAANPPPRPASLPADPNRPAIGASAAGRGKSKLKPKRNFAADAGGGDDVGADDDVDPDDVPPAAPRPAADRNELNRNAAARRRRRQQSGGGGFDGAEEEDEDEEDARRRAAAAASDPANASLINSSGASGDAKDRPPATPLDPAVAAAAQAAALNPANQQNIDREFEPPGLCARCCGSAAHGQAGTGVMGCFGTCIRSMCGFGHDDAVREMARGVLIPPDWKPDEPVIQKVLNSYPQGSVMRLTIRGADSLVPDARIRHPLMRVHILDLTTGTHWLKADPNRTAIAALENQRQTAVGGAAAGASTGVATPHILSFVSAPAARLSHAHSRPLSPVWMEDFLINEPIQNFWRSNSIMFFEMLDFGPDIDPVQFPGGLYPICWGFLKLLSKKGRPNHGRNVLLQLYQYTFNAPAAHMRNGVPAVYYEWVYQKNTGMVEYDSRLDIGLTGIHPPAPRTIKGKGKRPQWPTDTEVGSRSLFMDVNTVLGLGGGPPLGASGIIDPSHRPASVAGSRAGDESKDAMAEDDSDPLRLARLRDRDAACKVPNLALYNVSCGVHGCFALRFSPDGRFIAAACAEDPMFTIKLYWVSTGRLLTTWWGHHELVYDIAWSSDSRFVATASSDCTVKVWNLATIQQNQATIKDRHTAAVAATMAWSVLTHPSYVYTAVFQPDTEWLSPLAKKGALTSAAAISRAGSAAARRLLLFTGSYDCTIRLWSIPTVPAPGAQHRAALSVAPALLAVVTGHTAAINTLVFVPTGRRFFTGDAAGIVKVWDDTAPLTAPIAAARPPARKSRVDQKHAAGDSGADDDEDDGGVNDDGDAVDADGVSATYRGVAWVKRFQCSHTMAVASTIKIDNKSAAAGTAAATAAAPASTSGGAPAKAGAVVASGLAGSSGDPLSAIHVNSIHSLSYHEERNGANPKLVAYVRNNTLVLFSLSRWDVRRTFSGVESRRGTLRCTISPDGTFLLAGSEDGKAYFWELAGGRLVSVLDVGFYSALCDVTWHPNEHMVGFASYGVDNPFLLWQYAPPYMADAANDEETLELARATATANLSLVGNDRE